MKPKVVTIIAEIGQNHGGNMPLARKLIRLAKENGADLAKFQLYSTEGLERSPDVLEILRQGELSFDQAKMLFDFGAKIGIEVFFSVFDVERVRWCEEIGVKRYKAASSLGEIDGWFDLVEALRETGKEIIASIPKGESRFQLPWSRLNYMQPDGFIKFLYCLNQYPASINELEFKVLKSFDGFSDHTIGLDASKIALARGASIIEKHFAVTHEMGADAEYSMTPQELKELRGFAGLYRGAIEG